MASSRKRPRGSRLAPIDENRTTTQATSSRDDSYRAYHAKTMRLFPPQNLTNYTTVAKPTLAQVQTAFEKALVEFFETESYTSYTQQPLAAIFLVYIAQVYDNEYNHAGPLLDVALSCAYQVAASSKQRIAAENFLIALAHDTYTTGIELKLDNDAGSKFTRHFLKNQWRHVQNFCQDRTVDFMLGLMHQLGDLIAEEERSEVLARIFIDTAAALGHLPSIAWQPSTSGSISMNTYSIRP